MALVKTKDKLPNFFKPILWSLDFSQVDPERDRKNIILNAINYGTLAHWHWLVEHYGREEVKKVLAAVPATEFKPRARRLAGLMFAIDNFNYAPRGAD